VNSHEILAMADERFERRLTEESAAVRQEVSAIRAEVATHKDVSELRQDMTAGFIRLERELAKTRVDMIKWSFVFWTSQCVAILGFLFVFLRNG
jgi:hypothetical protein